MLNSIANRRWFLLATAVGFLALLIAGCGRDQNTHDDLAPSKPTLVDRSADDVYPQTGIRAEPVQSDVHHKVRLEWNANPEPDVVGYRIYRNREWDAPVRHYIIKELHIGEEIPAGATTYSFVDEGNDVEGVPMDLLAPDSTGRARGYYWEVMAFDEAGNRSQMSDRAYYRLLPNPSNINVGRVSEAVYSVTWDYGGSDESDRPSYAFIRVYSATFGPDSAIGWDQVFFYGSQGEATIDSLHNFHGMVADQTYVVQLNLINNQPNPDHAEALAGSAAYTTFVYHN
jgi:hypothetical protein